MILCKLLGHKMPRDGYYRGQPYFRRGRYRVAEGIGRIHQSLEADCARCGESFDFGMIHDYPKPETE